MTAEHRDTVAQALTTLAQAAWAKTEVGFASPTVGAVADAARKARTLVAAAAQGQQVGSAEVESTLLELFEVTAQVRLADKQRTLESQPDASWSPLGDLEGQIESYRSTTDDFEVESYGPKNMWRIILDASDMLAYLRETDPATLAVDMPTGALVEMGALNDRCVIALLTAAQAVQTPGRTVYARSLIGAHAVSSARAMGEAYGADQVVRAMGRSSRGY